MMSRVIESRLKAVLQEHGVKAADLLRAIQARYGARAISQPALYRVVKGDNGMPDSRTVEQVMHALMDLIGKPLALGEVFVWQPTTTPEGAEDAHSRV